VQKTNKRWGKKEDAQAFRVFKSMLEEADFDIATIFKQVCL
jgi:hypothetical protein